MLGAWVPILTFQNLDPAVLPAVEGGTCTRADLAIAPAAIVGLGTQDAPVALALSTSCVAPFGNLGARVEVPEC